MVKTSSSAVAKRPRDASYLSVVSFNSTKRSLFIARQHTDTRYSNFVRSSVRLSVTFRYWMKRA